MSKDKKDANKKKKMGRPPKFKSEKELKRKIQEYFDSLKGPKYDSDGNIIGEQFLRPPTITGLAVALNTVRSVLLDYEHGKFDDEKNNFSNTIKNAKARVEQFAEEELFRYKGTAAGVIFNLKNNFGWKDSKELTHKGDMEVNINVEGE